MSHWSQQSFGSFWTRHGWNLSVRILLSVLNQVYSISRACGEEPLAQGQMGDWGGEQSTGHWHGMAN